MKKKIYIDINDTVREFSKQYIKYFNIAAIDNKFNPDEVKYIENDLYSPFNFPSKKDKEDFEMDKFVFEVYGCAKPTHSALPGNFNTWLNDIQDENPQLEVWFISPGEYHTQRQATLFFLSKICSRVNGVYFPKSIRETWEECDILITANPKFLADIPEGKNVIKIKTLYNKKIKSKYSSNNFMNIILEDNNLIKSLI